jgi:hypothetical protein
MTDTVTGEFTVNIQEVKTTRVDNMQDVIKYVTWSVEYTRDGVKDSAGTYTTELPEPTLDDFTPFSDLTKEQLVGWIEATDERMPGIKNYIKHRVDTELEKASLETKLVPWAPVIEAQPPQSN